MYLLPFAVAALFLVHPASGQFNTLLGTHGRTGAGITQGVTIGNVLAIPVPTQAFQVRGDLLGIGNTGEVFLTNAPAANNTFWRLYSGGVGAATERGQLFANSGQTHFNINAPNGALRLYTNTLERARLWNTQTTVINGFTANPMVQDGFLGLSDQPLFFTATGNNTGPFSRLHLADNTNSLGAQAGFAQWLGHRPWMRNGISFTGNFDMSYIGQKYGAQDNTDMIIHWSNDPSNGQFAPDYLRFIFTANPNGALSGATSLEGLEAIRLNPINMTQVNVGIGDWFAESLVVFNPQQPSEKLDLLHGTIRLRDFADPASPYLTTDPLVDRVLVARPTDGVVFWRPASDFGDCDWTVEQETNSGPAIPHSVWTAQGTDDLCPDKDDMVGIGVIPSAGKLHVRVDRTTDLVQADDVVFVNMLTDVNDEVHGINVQMTPVNTMAYSQDGVISTATNATYRNVGLYGTAEINDAAVANSNENAGVFGRSNVLAGSAVSAYGVYGDAQVGDGTVSRNHALYGFARGGSTSFGVRTDVAGAATNHGGYFDASGSATVNYGVWTQAAGAAQNIGLYAQGPVDGIGVGNNWAAYIAGEGFISDGPWQTSDENLKQDIELMDAQPAQEVLSQLDVNTFAYRTDEFPQMGLPDGAQVGFRAQQMETLFPQLVRDAVHPSQYDATGNMTSPEVPFKAVNTTGLIPYLVLGYQSSTARVQVLEEQIAAQAEAIAAMQEVLAACCANPASDQRMHLENGGLIMGKGRDLVIVPNPFSEPPTVYYTLETAGRMQLVANSADGKQLSVLREAEQEAGEYQLVWDTHSLQPGMYYLTLLLDSEPVVKKAVKVQR